MRIAYITSLYATPGFGPARISQYLREYEGELKITFFTDDKPLSYPREIYIHKNHILSCVPGYWIIRSWIFFREFYRRKSQFDLVICSNAFEAFFLTLFIKNIEIMVMINDDNYIFTKNNFWEVFKLNSFRTTLSRYLGFYIEKFVVRKAHSIIACSDYLKESIKKNYRTEKGKVQVIYPSVDLGFFAPRERSYFQSLELNILFVKNEWRRGGLDIIIKGLSKYTGQKKINLHIVGTAENDNNLIMRLANKCGFTGSLNFYGILDKNELLNKFYKADVFIMLSRQEAFGISILEALATATPVIASNVGGIPEVLDRGKAGFLIEPGSPNALNAMLNNLIQNPDLIYPKIEHGLNYCKKFNKDNLYSSLEIFILRKNNR